MVRTLRHRTQRFYTILAIRTIGNFLILFSVIWMLVVFTPFIISESRFRYDSIFHNTYTLDKPSGPTFGKLLRKPPPLQIEPINTDNAIVVERINANSPIVFDVDPGSEKAYMDALKVGVAHAEGTVLPGEPGNSYLFAHSVGNAWDIARYNAVFFLLRELTPGDRVVIFRDGWRYDFRVSDKKIVEPTDVEFLTAESDETTITLQTCWPPGTVLKRLLVFGKLEAKYQLENKLLTGLP